jgi:hypothetical protein
MLAIAGDLYCVGGVMTILAAIFLAFLYKAIARRMRAHTFLFFGHGIDPPAIVQQFRCQNLR